MRSFSTLVIALSFGLLSLPACGGSTDSDGSSGGSGGQAGSGGSSTGGSGGIDCSKVGCGPAPMCDTGCTSACGCCSCGDGEKIQVDGGYLLCTGGCYTKVVASICGGLAGKPCAADEYCDYPDHAVCGGEDSTGVCVKKPGGCPADCPGVCGCDGKQYCNACGAHAAGVDVSGDTSCMGDGGAGTTCQNDNECSFGLKCCYPCGVPGCQNQCTQPMPNGECPMYP